MHVRFQMRYTVLLFILCIVLFGFWIILWPTNVANKCRDKIGPCPKPVLENGERRNSKEKLIGMIRDESDEKVRNKGYDMYAFNELISIRIGHHREIPDTRHNMCKSVTYSSHLPTASVVICFHNEAWSTLIRTVHSILHRTADYLLHEIILVDDFSTEEHLKGDLNAYVKDVKKVLLVRPDKRQGLIRGRALGASKATGDVLVFLDSHCEVNIDWLTPLLEPISKDRRTVVCPLIDIINSDTFQYSPSPLVKGGFNWGLYFQWEPIASSVFEKQEDFVKPIKSPTMAGGLFAIDREYFNKLGKYDDGMDIWGGENLEISFRIWMCGGELKIAPCSRVGHVFRDRRPYGSDGKGDTMSRNSMRVAEVWMDGYKKHFYDVRKDLKGKDYGDVSQRLELRRRLKCKSFKWFLYKVYPEIDIPSERKGSSLIWQHHAVKKNKLLHEGKLRNSLGYCLDVPATLVEKGIRLVVRRCDEVRSKNTWSLDDADQLKLRNKLCLDVKKPYNPRLMKCHESGGSQGWILIKTIIIVCKNCSGYIKLYDKESQLFYNPASGTCLSQSSLNKAIMAICNASDSSQKWSF